MMMLHALNVLTMPLLIGSFNYQKAQLGSKHHIAGLDTELQVHIMGYEQCQLPESPANIFIRTSWSAKAFLI